MFQQVFIERQYACVDNVAHPRLIVDCGANVGYASVYFLRRFPNAHVIAIEPDAANFNAMMMNLSAFGDRVKAIMSAVWSHSCNLAFTEVCSGRGLEWSRQVVPANSGATSGVRAVDIGTLLKESGYDRISILKVDVEGAEKAIFNETSASWLRKVDNVVIELHDDDARQVFHKAISSIDCDVSSYGELTVCKLLHRNGGGVATTPTTTR